MKVVLDANVVISGTITPGGLSWRILAAWRARQFEHCSSEHLLGEVARALRGESLRQRYRLADDDVAVVLEELAANATFPHLPVEPITAVRDPKDNMVLECAIGCEADLVVTNDEDLLALREFGGVGIVAPRDFLRTLGEPA